MPSSLAPTVTMSLVLLFLFVFAFSAEAGCYGPKMRKTSISGYFQYQFNGDDEVFYPNTNKVNALPYSNSAVKAIWRGARVRTGPNNYFLVGEYSNVTDDSGHRYNGAFALLGPLNQSTNSWRITVVSGTQDFSNATGSSYAQYFSSSFYRVSINLMFELCK